MAQPNSIVWDTTIGYFHVETTREKGYNLKIKIHVAITGVTCSTGIGIRIVKLSEKGSCNILRLKQANETLIRNHEGYG